MECFQVLVQQKKQIKKSVYFEGFILGLIGIPLGILSGVFAIYVLVQVVNYILKDYVSRGTLLTYKMSWFAVIVSIIVSVITIWLSCRKSAKKHQNNSNPSNKKFRRC